MTYITNLIPAGTCSLIDSTAPQFLNGFYYYKKDTTPAFTTCLRRHEALISIFFLMITIKLKASEERMRSITNYRKR